MQSNQLTVNNEQLTSKNQLLDRILRFAIDIISLVDKLPRSPAGMNIANQLVRSATSIGANTEEAKESKYWLKLIRLSHLQSSYSVERELKEADELCAIFSVIVKKAKVNLLNVKSQMLNANGQSLLEVTVAVAIGTLVVAALTFATIFSLRNANFAKNSAQATKLAHEGIERVRSSRDRNQCIEGLTNVNSWNGSTDCSAVSGSGSIWTYPISGDCDKPDLPQAGFCYFKVNSTTGQLTNIGFSFTPTSSVPLPAQAEGIPTTNPVFKRVILLSDDLNHDKNFTNDDYQNQKEVTVIVTWNDFAGTHESRLTTILRKL